MQRTLTVIGKKADSMKFKAIASALALAAVAPVASQAQTGTSYGLGSQGAPAASDYLTAATGFSAGIAPILTSTLPLLLGMLAIWQGPRIVKGLVQRFSR